MGFEKPIYNGKKLQPVTHLRMWLDQAGIEEGYVFRRLDWAGAAIEKGLTGHWIARIVQHYATLIGIYRQSIGAHSLRSGFITSAGERHAPLYKIMEVTGRKTLQAVLRYLRRLSSENLLGKVSRKASTACIIMSSRLIKRMTNSYSSFFREKGERLTITLRFVS